MRCTAVSPPLGMNIIQCPLSRNCNTSPGWRYVFRTFYPWGWLSWILKIQRASKQRDMAPMFISGFRRTQHCTPDLRVWNGIELLFSRRREWIQIYRNFPFGSFLQYEIWCDFDKRFIVRCQNPTCVWTRYWCDLKHDVFISVQPKGYSWYRWYAIIKDRPGFPYFCCIWDMKTQCPGMFTLAESYDYFQ